jgi:hypothetical protein
MALPTLNSNAKLESLPGDQHQCQDPPRLRLAQLLGRLLARHWLNAKQKSTAGDVDQAAKFRIAGRRRTR